MVAADDDFLRMGKGSQPVNCRLDFTDGAIIGEVASMDQKVTVGHFGPFKRMGVRDTDHADGFRMRWWESRGATEVKQGAVNRIQQREKWGRNEIVWQRTTMVGIRHGEQGGSTEDSGDLRSTV